MRRSCIFLTILTEGKVTDVKHFVRSEFAKRYMSHKYMGLKEKGARPLAHKEDSFKVFLDGKEIEYRILNNLRGLAPANDEIFYKLLEYQ